jgi:hypothetical protein
MFDWPYKEISFTEANMPRRTFLFLIVALAQAACIPFGDAWIDFSGHVRDTSGKPVEGVLMTILINGKARDDWPRVTSDKDGAYSIHRSACPCQFDFEVIASKEGFVAFSKKTRAQEALNLRTLDIVLEREPRYKSSAQPSKGAGANP